MSLLGLALALAAPALAQNTVAPASNGVVGPSELRDFSLGGPVREPALTVPGPAGTQPAARPPARQPRPADSGPSTSATRSSPQARLTPAPGEFTAPPSQREATPDVSSTQSLTLPPPAPVAAPAADGASELGSQPGLLPVAPPPSASVALDPEPPLWPWLVAALLAGLAAVYYGTRQRSRPRRLAADGSATFVPAEPEAQAAVSPRAPAPPPAPAAPPPRAPAPDAGMIVSKRLKPSLDIQFMPERLIFDGNQAAIEFAVMVFNSGNAPARELLVEAAMFNAGASQDQEIGAFFAHPVGRGERINEILPLNSLTLRSTVILPAAQMRVYEVEGRKLFVPLVGFNALYRWSGKDAQVSESFIVGVDTQGERMGPFRLDAGARQFRNLGARAHSVRLRK